MPPLITPSQATANTNSNAAEAALVATGNAAFIQTITALIDSAIPLSLFSVAPPIPINVDYNAISTYFTGLGYTVTISLATSPFWGWSNCFPAAGFPEVIPPVFVFWSPLSPPPAYPSPGWTSWQIYVQRHHPLVTITWGSP